MVPWTPPMGCCPSQTGPQWASPRLQLLEKNSPPSLTSVSAELFPLHILSPHCCPAAVFPVLQNVLTGSAWPAVGPSGDNRLQSGLGCGCLRRAGEEQGRSAFGSHAASLQPLGPKCRWAQGSGASAPQPFQAQTQLYWARPMTCLRLFSVSGVKADKHA